MSKNWRPSDGRSLRGAHLPATVTKVHVPTKLVGGHRGPPVSRPKAPIRDDAYMAFVREHPCVFASTSCVGPIEAHHHGKHAMSVKTDDLRCVPLCTWHHRDVTDRGYIVALGIVLTNAHLAGAQVELLIEWYRRKEDEK